MTMRHPIRGLIGGLILGLGVALLLVFLGIAVLGTWTVIGVVLGFGLIGLVFALVWPAKQVRPPQ